MGGESLFDHARAGLIRWRVSRGRPIADSDDFDQFYVLDLFNTRDYNRHREEGSSVKILVLYGSTRRQGNSELLAEAVVEGLPASRIHLAEQALAPILDQRHDPGGFQPTSDDYDALMAQLLAHEILIFVTPIYWYGLSGVMKNFVDRWSQALRDRRFNFAAAMKQKTAYLVVTGGDQPRLKGLPLVQQFVHICQYVGLPIGGYIIGEGNRPGEVLQDQQAMHEAALLNERLRMAVQEGVDPRALSPKG